MHCVAGREGPHNWHLLKVLPSPLPQNHPREALHLALALYEDFCVMLPNAADPLFGLALVSPHVAYHLTQAFTTLHPFYRGRGRGGGANGGGRG